MAWRKNFTKIFTYCLDWLRVKKSFLFSGRYIRRIKQGTSFLKKIDRVLVRSQMRKFNNIYWEFGILYESKLMPEFRRPQLAPI